jgi:predicted RNA methylase
MEKIAFEALDKIRNQGMNFLTVQELITILKKEEGDIHRNDILEILRNNRNLNLHITPNPLAKTIADFAAYYKSENAIDICCGIGNILYYLQNQMDDLTGVELIADVAQLARNLIPEVNIITADTFSYPFEKRYDLVVGNLPWGLKIKVGEKYVPGEMEFIRKAFSICKEQGAIIVVVPYSFLIGSQFQNFRNELTEANKLEAIISLPTGIMRYSNVRTAVLIFKLNKSTNTVFISKWDEHKNIVSEYSDSSAKRFDISKIKDRWDTEYYLSDLPNVINELDSFTTQPLHELAEIINGRYKTASMLASEGEYLYLKPVHLKKNDVQVSDKDLYINKSELTESDNKAIAKPGDIIISTIFNELKLHIYTKEDPPAYISNNLAIIRSRNSDYILSYLQTEEGQRIFKSQANLLVKGITIPHLTISDIKEIKIPVLPTHELNALGNYSISTAPLSQLEQSLSLVSEYKSQVEKLQIENEELRTYKSFLNDRFLRLESQIIQVHKKLDQILSVLKELRSDFEKIKGLSKTDEEKIFKLCQAMDSKLETILKDQKPKIDNYIEEIKQWLDLWDLLDATSQKFLPLAEYLFDELDRIPEADFSPFILQYCRTLENEIFKKLFEAYHQDGLIDVDKEELTREDLSDTDTSIFAKMVLKNDLRYELGKMSRIMSYLKENGKTLSKSRLLQHFRAFTINYFDKRILEREFLQNLEEIRDDFRNKAAHPAILDLAVAKDCQFLLRKCLNDFLDSKKQ